MRLRWASPLLLVVSATVLALLWDRIPDSWPTHWDARGRPNGWAHKTWFDLFLPILLGFVFWGGLEGLAAALSRIASGPRQLVEAVASVVSMVAFAMAALFSGLALALPLLRPRSPLHILGATLLLFAGVLILASSRLVGVTRRLRESGVPGLDGWNGLFYRNSGDPRVWVPNVVGLGWTLNFARWQAWIVLLFLLLPAAVVVILVVTAQKS